MKEIDVRALACPGPVIEVRKLLDAGERELRVLVADELARSNVTRFAGSRRAEVTSEALAEGGFAVTVHAGEGSPVTPPACDRGSDYQLPERVEAMGAGRPLVVQVTSDRMGRGDDDLGALLLRSFIKTQLQLERPPDTMIFYNAGVRLCCEGSPLIDDLLELADRGAEVLACGTCLNYFQLSSSLQAGRVTDMLEIATRLAEAGHIVRP